MARPTMRESDVARVMADYVNANPFLADVLVMNDATGTIAATIGVGATSWNRRAGGKQQATAWPQLQTFDAIILRLPKAKDELAMTLASAHGCLKPNGELFLYGPNNEGIKSAPKHLEPLFDRALTETTRGHCRIIRARRAETEAPKHELSDWRETVTLESPAGDLTLVSYPGLFAHGRLDAGSETLLNHLPKTSGPISVLDFGCGAGVLTLGLRAHNADIQPTLIDNDAVALAAVGENLPGATTILGTSMADLGDARFDLIVSNPPVHSGKAQDFTMLEDLCRNAPGHLTSKGCLQIVVQRTAPAARLLSEAFTHVDLVAENKSFRVWRAY